MRKGEEFRRRGQECHRLSTQLLHAAHRSFAIELAKAWTALAQYEERKELIQIEAAQVGDGGRWDDLAYCSIGEWPTSGGAARVIVVRTLSPDRSSRPVIPHIALQRPRYRRAGRTEPRPIHLVAAPPRSRRLRDADGDPPGRGRGRHLAFVRRRHLVFPQADARQLCPLASRATWRGIGLEQSSSQ
jgi:hypothetical protein